MPLPESLQSAVKSLTAALDLLEAAVDRRAEAEAARADLEQELAIMEDDRSRLGEALERSRLDCQRLRDAQTAAVERLDRLDQVCGAALGRPAP